MLKVAFSSRVCHMLFILLQFDDLQKKYTYFGKEVRLKLLKKKIFKISSMTHYHFYSKKKSRNENRNLKDSYNVFC